MSASPVARATASASAASAMRRSASGPHCNSTAIDASRRARVGDGSVPQCRPRFFEEVDELVVDIAGAGRPRGRMYENQCGPGQTVGVAHHARDLCRCEHRAPAALVAGHVQRLGAGQHHIAAVGGVGVVEELQRAQRPFEMRGRRFERELGQRALGGATCEVDGLVRIAGRAHLRPGGTRARRDVCRCSTRIAPRAPLRPASACGRWRLVVSSSYSAERTSAWANA